MSGDSHDRKNQRPNERARPSSATIKLFNSGIFLSFGEFDRMAFIIVFFIQPDSTKRFHITIRRPTSAFLAEQGPNQDTS